MKTGKTIALLTIIFLVALIVYGAMFILTDFLPAPTNQSGCEANDSACLEADTVDNIYVNETNSTAPYVIYSDNFNQDGGVRQITILSTGALYALLEAPVVAESRTVERILTPAEQSNLQALVKGAQTEPLNYEQALGSDPSSLVMLYHEESRRVQEYRYNSPQMQALLDYTFALATLTQ